VTSRRVLVVAGLVAALGVGSRASGGLPVDGAPAVGPSASGRPAEGARASSFAELRELVERPDGPSHVTLAPGTFRGDLTIVRPLRISGSAGSTLEGTGLGTVVTIKASDVALEDLVVRHSGRRHTTEDAGIKATGDRISLSRVRVEDALFGVSLLECHGCLVEAVHVRGDGEDSELRGDGIKLWESNDSIVRGCLVEGARDLVVWYTKRATLERNVVRHSRYGAHFMYAHDARVVGNRFEHDVVGVFVMYSLRLRVERNVLAGARGAAGVGLGLKDSDAVDVVGNWLVGNTTGTYLDNTPRTPEDPVTFEGNVLAVNDVAARFHGAGAGVTMRGNELKNNAVVVEVDGGGHALAVRATGNHFSDYEGYDLDGDGVGDVPYEVKALSSDLTEKHPALKMFHGTAALGVVDAVARAVPVFANHLLFVDRSPRIAPLALETP
jgi:nitrous oxidase accessory protein